MAPQKFSIAKALEYGWTALKSHFGFFIALIVCVVGFVGGLNYVVARAFPEETYPALVVWFIVGCVELFFNMVVLKISLDIYDKGAPELSVIRSLPRLFLKFLGAQFLMGLIVGGVPAFLTAFGMAMGSTTLLVIGRLLLIFPGLYFFYMFLFQNYLIVDAESGPVEALKESKRATQGSKLWLLLFSLALLGINLVGLIVVIGLLVTMPISIMATVYVYRQLVPKRDVAAA